jgi:hypothetical protein
MNLTIKDFYSQAVIDLTNSGGIVTQDDNGNITEATFVNDNVSLPSQTNIDAKAQELLDAHNAEVQAKADLKASAKAKLIAGEALTEDEANTIVL